MVWVFVAFAILVVLGAALLLTGRADPGTDQSAAAPAVPQPPITADDVRSLTFRVGLRGYRMADVDAALAAIAADLAARQSTDAVTESGAVGPDASSPVPPPATAAEAAGPGS